MPAPLCSIRTNVSIHFQLPRFNGPPSSTEQTSTLPRPPLAGVVGPNNKIDGAYAPLQGPLRLLPLPIMDEGRNMILPFPSLIQFQNETEKQRFMPKLVHISSLTSLAHASSLPAWLQTLNCVFPVGLMCSIRNAYSASRISRMICQANQA